VCVGVGGGIWEEEEVWGAKGLWAAPSHVILVGWVGWGSKEEACLSLGARWGYKRTLLITISAHGNRALKPCPDARPPAGCVLQEFRALQCSNQLFRQVLLYHNPQVLSSAAIGAQLLYAAPSHLACTISGYR
jgi:hypothetical protein